MFVSSPPPSPPEFLDDGHRAAPLVHHAIITRSPAEEPEDRSHDAPRSAMRRPPQRGQDVLP